jgi:hypothetical protein
LTTSWIIACALIAVSRRKLVYLMSDVSITDLAEFVGHQTDEAMEAWERYRSSPSTPGWEKFPVAWIEQDAFIAGWGARTVYVEPEQIAEGAEQ